VILELQKSTAFDRQDHNVRNNTYHEELEGPEGQGEPPLAGKYVYSIGEERFNSCTDSVEYYQACSEGPWDCVHEQDITKVRDDDLV
jgi:hypothetical protein